MSNEKHEYDHHEIAPAGRDVESGQPLDGHGLKRALTTVTLTPEQFESLYLQPRSSGNTGGLVRRLGNSAPLGISAFLLAQTPLAMDLLGFQSATAASGVATLGAFYGAAGIGLWIASIMEWAAGNTFPMVVFGSFGGFWISYGVLVQPTQFIAASFAASANLTSTAADSITAAAAGAASPEYNSGLAMYTATWTGLCFIYFLAALRTNVPFVLVFFSLVGNFASLTGAYIHTAMGDTSRAAMEFKMAGGFSFLTALAGFWIDISLILAAVEFPIPIPLFDLSGLRFMQPRSVRAARSRTE